MKVHQFTHTDLDGVGCAVVAHAVFPAATTQYVEYDDVDIKILSWLDAKKHDGDKLMLLITDIAPVSSVVVERLTALAAGVGPVVVCCYDHHKTSVERLANVPWFHGNTQRCGTVLTYNALLAEAASSDAERLVALNDFSHAVDAYDRWLVGHPLRSRGEDLNRLCWALGREEFVRRFAQSPTADSDGELRFLSSVLREKERRETRAAVDRQLKRKLYVDEKGYRFGILDSGGNPSAIGHLYLQDKPEADYVMLINISMGNVALRSREGGVDVSQVAKAYGGGGHPTAAGFILPSDALDAFFFVRRL